VGRPRKTTETFFFLHVFESDGSRTQVNINTDWASGSADDTGHSAVRMVAWLSQGRYEWSLVVRKHHLVVRMWPSGTYPLGETVKMLCATGRRDKWQFANLHTVSMDNRKISYVFKSRYWIQIWVFFKRNINWLTESTKEWRLRNECLEIQSFKIAFNITPFRRILATIQTKNLYFPISFL